MRTTTIGRRMMRATTATVLSGALGAGLLTLGATAPADATEAFVAPVTTTCGTWVLQQATGSAQLNKMATNIDNALATPGVVGLSLRVPWDAYEADPTVLDTGLKLARAEGKQLSIRFMAGRNTPARIFEAGAYSIASSVGRVPTPFSPTGTAGNPVFEREYAATAAKLAAWSRANGVSLLHLPWYGFQWAEIYNGSEIEAAPGYSWNAWLQGHQNLARIAQDVAGTDLAVELPLSGHWGTRPSGSGEVADMLVGVFGADHPSLLVQGNGMGRFNNDTTNRPITHAKQMYDGGDYDWASIYSTLVANKEKYLEVYTTSFTASSAAQLANQAQKFATDVCDAPPSVSMTDPPSVARGTVPLAAQATVGSKVEYLVDGTVVGTGTSTSWDSATVADGAHSLQARATDASGRQSTSPVHTFTVDNAPPPTLSVSSPRAVEADSGTTAVEVTFTLSRAATQSVSASYATSDATASAGLDYKSATGTVQFPAGVTSVVRTVPVMGDAKDEPDETFVVDTSSLVGATRGQAGTVTITDDDEPLPTMTVGDVTVAEGNRDKSVAVPVQLSGPTDAPVSIDWTTESGSAVTPSDFTAKSGTLWIPAGSTSGSIWVTVKGDRTKEATESFKVRLSNPNRTTLLDGLGVVTLTNDD